MVMELLATSLADVLHSRGDPAVARFLQTLGGKLLTTPGKEAIGIGIAHGMMSVPLLTGCIELYTFCRCDASLTP